MRANDLWFHRADKRAAQDVPRILIVGSGFAGFHCARELERRLRPDEAQVTLASPTDYMLYSPLLPHVAAGVLNPSDIAVSLRRSLQRILRAPCHIVGVDLDDRVCIARTILGEDHAVGWDRLVLCPGAATRTFPIPGLERYGRGMKTLAEATYLHDHVLAELELGNAVTDKQRRAAHCTFVVVGAGYAGTETAANLRSFASHALLRFINLRPADLNFVIVDAAPHVLPELGDHLGAEALTILQRCGLDVRLNTQVTEVSQDRVVLSDGQTLPCRTLVWTAGVTASPLLATLGLPTGRASRLVVSSELQVPQRPDVFAAGDAAAVPDLTKPEGAITPPTAQHAQRQGILLARNVIRSIRGEPCQPYRHRDLGLVVDLGGTHSVARPLGRNLSGVPAQVITRGYHLSALPSPRTRVKASADWLWHAIFGADFIRLGLPDTDSATLTHMLHDVDYLTSEATHEMLPQLPHWR